MSHFSRSPWRPSQIVVLAVLFIACGTLTAVVIAQNQTIKYQQAVILVLYEDSAKLAHIEMEQAPHPTLHKNKK
jgi:hypothetical protein